MHITSKNKTKPIAHYAITNIAGIHIWDINEADNKILTQCHTSDFTRRKSWRNLHTEPDTGRVYFKVGTAKIYLDECIKTDI